MLRLLELLDPQPGDHVLDVGSGSGWTSALLGKLVGEKGSVVAVEKIPELLTFGKRNCEKQDAWNVTFHQAHGGIVGLPEEGPYDRILVSAAAEEVFPDELWGQQKLGGRLVMPIGKTYWGNEMLVADRISENQPRIHTVSGFFFVPLIMDGQT